MNVRSIQQVNIHIANIEKPNTGTIKITKDGMIYEKLTDMLCDRNFINITICTLRSNPVEMGLLLSTSYNRLGRIE